MPIKPENKCRYPTNWKEIRKQILERANHRCEQCGLQNHSIGYRHNGEFVHMPQALKDAGTQVGHIVACDDGSKIKIIKIVLTIAHLDHVPENCHPDNLRAWCQKCHLAYDHEHHQRNARETRRKKQAAMDMFEVTA